MMSLAPGKKYKCSQCVASFDRPSNLKLHNAKHSADRPYSCYECKKTFKRSDDRARHEKLHTGGRHACSRCQQTFTRQSTLVRHQRKLCQFSCMTDISPVSISTLEKQLGNSPASVALPSSLSLPAPDKQTEDRIYHNSSYWSLYFTEGRYSLEWIKRVFYRACVDEPNPSLVGYLLREMGPELKSTCRRQDLASKLVQDLIHYDDEGPHEIIGLLGESMDITHLSEIDQCYMLMQIHGSGPKLLGLLRSIEADGLRDIERMLEALFKNKWKKATAVAEEAQDFVEPFLGVAMLKTLVAKLSHINEYVLPIVKYTTLALAVEQEAPVLYICRLLEQGADPTVKNLFDETPLHLAAKKPCARTFYTLLQTAPQLLFKSSDVGYIPLHLAAKMGFSSHIRLMLQHNPAEFINTILPNCDKHYKGTVLHLVVDRSEGMDYNIIRALLHWGANPNIANSRGEKPLQLLILYWFGRAITGLGVNPDDSLVKSFLEFSADITHLLCCGCSLITAAMFGRVYSIFANVRSSLVAPFKWEDFPNCVSMLGGSTGDPLLDAFRITRRSGYDIRRWEYIIAHLRRAGSQEMVCCQHKSLKDDQADLTKHWPGWLRQVVIPPSFSVL